MSLPPFADAVRVAAGAFDQLGIPYLVGGSVATLVHGEPRTTQDVDIIVELASPQVDALVAALLPQFFVDRELINLGLRHRIASNVVHRDTGLKLDLFPLRERPFSRIELERGAKMEIVPGCVVRVASAEDCVLTKLEWFRKGGEVSDRQWRDVQGVLKVQRGRLDMPYLRRWAAELGIVDLHDRAMREAGLDQPRA